MNIFIINLKRDLQRRAFMQQQFDSMDEQLKQNFDIAFFDAIDCRAGEHTRFKQYSLIRSYFFRANRLSDGEIGCFASHYCLWQKCLEINESIVVLEDDVEILDNFFSELLRIKNSEYSYVRLYHIKTGIRSFELPDGFYTSFDKFSGTQGYYLTPAAAQRLIESARVWYSPVDDYMDMFYIHNVLAVCVKPILKTGQMESSISSRWGKAKWYLKIIRECTRLYFQCRKAIFLLFCKRHLLLPKNILDSIHGSRNA